jgi:hypothetical protein
LEKPACFGSYRWRAVKQPTTAPRMSGIKTDAAIRDARSLRATVTLHHDRLSERSYLFTMSDITHPHAASRLHDGHEFNFSANELRATARIRTTAWWSQTGSNRRPHACKARALPTELWPHLRKKARCLAEAMVGLGRLELPTSRLSSARSNQLSYKPGLRSQ